MNYTHEALLIVISIIVIVLGLLAAQNIVNYYSPSSKLNSQAAGSVIYIENGVSGVVTISDPYLNKTSDINVVYDPLDSGSGFVVNSDGYIITAFHVVGDPQAIQNQGVLRLMDSSDIQLYLERAAVTGYISKYNPQIGSELISNQSNSSPVIQSQPNTNTTTDLMNNMGLIHVKSSKQQIRVRLPGSGAGDYINANLVDVGNAANSEDMALLKINVFFPTQLYPLTINTKTPDINEPIQIYGYPVVNEGMYSNYNQSALQPSSSAGVITTELPNQGTVYFETTAKTLHGFSGGPVLDNDNNVLGIIIYSLINSNNTQNSASVFLSSQYIVQLCNKNNVTINQV